MYSYLSYPHSILIFLRRSSLVTRRTMQPKRTARQHKYEKDTDLPSGLRTLQLGAWRVVYQDKRKSWSKFSPNLFALFDLKLTPAIALKIIRGSYIARFAIDVYLASPGLIVWYLFVNGIMSLQPALELQTSNRLFKAVCSAHYINITPSIVC